MRVPLKFLHAPAAAVSALTGLSGIAFAVGESPPIAYHLHCQGCHMEDGMGAAEVGRVPRLPGMAGHFLKHAKGRLYLCSVPGVVNAGLPAGETANLLNYVLEHYSASDLPKQWQRFTGDEVRQLWETKVDDIAALRNEIASDLAKQGIDLRY